MSPLSRRSFFAELGRSGYAGLGGIGLHGTPPARRPTRQAAGGFALHLSAEGSVDLNVTAEQAVDIPHCSGAKPPVAKVVLVDLIQDDPAVDTSALRWAAGYPVYDEAASTTTAARIWLRFATPAGIAATGRARILLEK